MAFALLLVYVGYRVLFAVVGWIQNAVGRFTGWSGFIGRMQTDPACDTCEVCIPLLRRKAYEGDPCRTFDFLLWHKSFVPMKSLVDPKWTIYCAGKDWIYFVYSWRTMRDYQSRKVPFVYMQQVPDAELVARMSIPQFCRFSDMLGLPKPRVFFMSNMPRAGTTLLTSLLQASDKLIALSEPDIYTHLATLKELGQFDQATLNGIVKTSFCKICHEFNSDDVVIIKPQSSGGILVPEMNAALPDNVQHLFLYRQTVDAAMKSIERMLSVDGMVMETITAMGINEQLAVKLIGFTRYQAKQFIQLRPQTVLEYAHLLYVGPLVWFLEAQKLGIPVHVTKFEDIIGDTRQTMKRLFDHLGVLTTENEDELLANALDAMKVDSQAGSFLAKELLAKVPVTPLTPEIRAKFDDANKLLGLPAMFQEGLVPEF